MYINYRFKCNNITTTTSILSLINSKIVVSRSLIYLIAYCEDHAMLYIYNSLDLSDLIVPSCKSAAVAWIIIKLCQMTQYSTPNMKLYKKLYFFTLNNIVKMLFLHYLFSIRHLQHSWCKFKFWNFAELYRQVWLKLNTVLPRCLWVMTIKEFMHEKSILPTLSINQENIVLDPLQVLRWDTRAFRYEQEC